MFLAGDSMKTKEEIVQEYEARAKNTLKAELKRRGLTYAQLAEKLKERGIEENDRNLSNKISRGSFTTAFFLMCMDAIGASQLQLDT
jgi:ribosome-binding protein aMBF1 (putative translation factor)